MRDGHSPEVERLLDVMDEIYAQLVTMDFPDALTYGLRRRTGYRPQYHRADPGDVTFSSVNSSLKR